MKVAVSCNGADLQAPMTPHFGRCPGFMIVDTGAKTSEFVGNRGLTSAGGAGIAAAQQVIKQGVEALITGRLGPNAFELLQEANIALYQGQGGSVGEEIEHLLHGRLLPITSHGEAHPGRQRHGQNG